MPYTYESDEQALATDIEAVLMDAAKSIRANLGSDEDAKLVLATRHDSLTDFAYEELDGHTPGGQERYQAFLDLIPNAEIAFRQAGGRA